MSLGGWVDETNGRIFSPDWPATRRLLLAVSGPLGRRIRTNIALCSNIALGRKSTSLLSLDSFQNRLDCDHMHVYAARHIRILWGPEMGHSGNTSTRSCIHAQDFCNVASCLLGRGRDSNSPKIYYLYGLSFLPALDPSGGILILPPDVVFMQDM